MNPSSTPRALRLYFQLSYLVVLVLSWGYFRTALGSAGSGIGTQVFAFLVLLTYPALYLLPASLLTLAVAGLTSLTGLRRWRRAATMTVAVLATTTTGITLLIDRRVWELFGFHLNGFVWNLIVTPGGIEALESSDSAVMNSVLRAVGVLLLQTALLWVAVRWTRRSARYAEGGSRGRWSRSPLLISLWMLLMVAQTLAYAFSQLHGYAPVVVAATSFPAYQPLTIRHLAERVGMAPEREANLELDGPALALDYPLAPIEIDDSQPRPNIVWLCAESLRADALDPEIMPESWALAQRSVLFERHYSSGNATRMGAFGMFYGLYASYWFAMLAERRPPVLIDVLERRGYHIEAWTSATFTYPEFDKTVFASLPPERVHPRQKGLQPHENDRLLVEGLEQLVRDESRTEPFFAFLFFDATHAGYSFDPSNVIRRPYAEAIDYVTMDVESEVTPMLNRYWNACHDVDGRVGDVVRLLESEGLMGETILIVTGDHGQEFLEHGRWGHNSAFNEEQLRVPLILYLPGEPARRVEHITSHLGLPTTLLSRLGVSNPPEHYSLGDDLLAPPASSWVVAGNWSQFGFVDEQVKITLPFRGSFLFQSEVTDSDDEVVQDPARWISQRRGELLEVIAGMGRFARRP